MKPPARIYYTRVRQDEFEGLAIKPDIAYEEYALLPPWSSELPTEDGWYRVEIPLHGKTVKEVRHIVAIPGKPIYWHEGEWHRVPKHWRVSGPIAWPGEGN